MKKHVLIFVMLPVLFSLLSCEGAEQQKNMKDRPFIDIFYTSNADTLFLLWELTDTELSFDHYQIEVGKSKEIVQTVGKDKEGCIFTHLPYSNPVRASVSLVENGNTIKTSSINVTIDGLDKVIARVLIPDRDGVTSGDGMFSIALPDGRSFFSMQDSFTGTVVNGVYIDGLHMYRNTYFVYDNGQVSTIWPLGNQDASASIPTCCPDESKWYWPGHGFVEGDKLYSFQSLMYQATEGAWGFAVEQVHILTYELPGLQLTDDRPIPYIGSERVYESALNDGDYVYIYAQVGIQGGLDPIAEVMVARAAPNNPYTGWQYYDGSGWSNDPADAVRLEGLSGVPVAALSVFKLRDKYVLLTEHQALWVGNIYTFISDTPYGPWRNKQVVFTAQEASNLNTYNATAHPQFQKDGMILVSYNVNSNTDEFFPHLKDASLYRPRFFWVEIDKILNE
jgi:hypothetical protein